MTADLQSIQFGGKAFVDSRENLVKSGKERAVPIGVEDFWVDIVLAAGRRAVAQEPGHLAHRPGDILLRLRGGFRLAERPQAGGGAHRRMPGPDILGGEFGPGRFLQISVHVLGSDGAQFALAVHVAEQLLAREVEDLPQDAGDPPVLDASFVPLAGFPPEGEADLRGLHVHMAALQGGEAEGVVLAQVGFIADTDQALFQEADDGCEDLLPGEAAPAEIGGNAAAENRQDLGEMQDMGKLDLIAEGGPVGMIEILLAPPGVAAGRLQMSPRRGADPDLAPGRWNDQGSDALQGLRIANSRSIRRQVPEPHAAPAPADAGESVMHVVKADRPRRSCRVAP